MPNWCENTLWVDGDPTDIKRFRKDVKTKEHDLALSKLHPMPEALINIDAESDKPNWYDWCIKNWGTKWDVVDSKLVSDFGDSLEYFFLSAYNPPVAWLKKISKRFPKVQFRLKYEEEGIGFMGIAKVKNGKVDDKWLDMH